MTSDPEQSASSVLRACAKVMRREAAATAKMRADRHEHGFTEGAIQQAWANADFLDRVAARLVTNVKVEQLVSLADGYTPVEPMWIVEAHT